MSAAPARFPTSNRCCIGAPVVSFCSSIYYLSSWHRCLNPNSNRKVLEKKKNHAARLHSSPTYAKCVQRESKLEPLVWQASALTTTLPSLHLRSVKVPYLSRINGKKSNITGCRCSSDLMSETGTGALDSTLQEMLKINLFSIEN